MQIAESAATRLQSLLERSGTPRHGFRVEGIIGTCRGSTPVIKPAAEPAEDEREVKAGPIRFFAKKEVAGILEEATLEYDNRLLGRGLVLTWKHRENGCPGCR